MVHLTRYPDRHAGLLHHTLKSRVFLYTGMYTSFVLALGFTEHTRHDGYLLQSIRVQSRATYVLLIHNNTKLPFECFGCMLELGILETVLEVMSTERLETLCDDDLGCNKGAVRMHITDELARRQNKNKICSATDSHTITRR